MAFLAHDGKYGAWILPCVRIRRKSSWLLCPARDTWSMSASSHLESGVFTEIHARNTRKIVSKYVLDGIRKSFKIPKRSHIFLHLLVALTAFQTLIECCDPSERAV